MFGQPSAPSSRKKLTRQGYEATRIALERERIA